MNSTTHIDEDDATSAGLMSPLMLAIKLRRERIVRLLLEHDAVDVHWKRPHNGMSAIHMGALCGNAGAVLDATG